MDNILQMWRTLKNSNNPQQLFEQMLSSNPELKQTVDTIKSMGDPEKLFYTLAQRQGADANAILNMLK